jgi:hypothetical protein
MIEMQKAKSGEVWNQYAYQYTTNLSASGVTDWISIPASVEEISVTLVPASGTSATVQTTTDTIADVISGVATAVNWSNGVVSSITQDSCEPVTAIRLYQTTAGTSKLTMRAQ